MAAGKSINIKDFILGLVYSKTEIDTKLADKVDTDDMTTALAAKADASSTTTALAGKSDVGHTHTGSDVLLGTEQNQKTLSTKLGEIDSAIGALQTADWDIEIVTQLPNEGVAGKLYFLHDIEEAANGDGNSFDEYIYDATNERFERLGQRKINLSNYVTDVNMELSDSGVLTVSLTKGTNAFSL